MTKIFFASVFLVISTLAFGQIRLDEPKPVYFKCPQIPPPAFEKLDGPPEHAAQATFEHYFIPVLRVGRYATYLMNPGSSVGQELYDVYKNQVEITKKDAILIDLVTTIKLSYQDRATFENLDTKGALALLSTQQKSEYSATLGKAIVCIAPGANNPSTLEVNFYGLRGNDCKRLKSNTAFAITASKLFINGKEGADCEDDFKGKGLKFLRFWSNYGRNQLTFVFPKL